MRMRQGFTLVELLVVLSIIALLLSIAAPRYFGSLTRANEAVLRTDLRMLREAIDRCRADTGQYPSTLDALVTGRYIRSIPVDPMTDSASTWILVPAPEASAPGVHDIRSGAQGASSDGTAYASW